MSTLRLHCRRPSKEVAGKRPVRSCSVVENESKPQLIFGHRIAEDRDVPLVGRHNDHLAEFDLRVQANRVGVRPLEDEIFGLHTDQCRREWHHPVELGVRVACRGVFGVDDQLQVGPGGERNTPGSGTNAESQIDQHLFGVTVDHGPSVQLEVGTERIDPTAGKHDPLGRVVSDRRRDDPPRQTDRCGAAKFHRDERCRAVD